MAARFLTQVLEQKAEKRGLGMENNTSETNKNTHSWIWWIKFAVIVALVVGYAIVRIAQGSCQKKLSDIRETAAEIASARKGDRQMIETLESQIEENEIKIGELQSRIDAAKGKETP